MVTVVAPEVRDEVAALAAEVASPPVRAGRGRRATASWSPRPATRPSTGRSSTTPRPPGSGSTAPTTRPAAPSPCRPGCGTATCSSRCPPAARSPALAAWLRDELEAGLGPEYSRRCSTCSPPSAERMRAEGRPTDAPGLARRPSNRGCWSASATVMSRGPRSCCARVCRRHRPEPPHRSARPARADDRRRRTPAQGAARPRRPGQPLRGRRALDLQPHRGLRRRRAVPRRLRRRARLPRRARPSWRPRTSPTTSTSGTTTRPSAHLFEVAAGLDSAVLGESEILGQVGDAWDVARDEGAAGAHPQPAVPPRPRGRQAGPHRDGHRPRHHVGLAGRRRPRRRAPRRPRRPPCPRGRRRRHGRGHGRGPGRLPASTRCSSPTAPPGPAEALADARRRPGHRPLRAHRPPRRRRRAAHLHRRPVARSSSTPTSPRAMDAACRPPAARHRHRRAPRRRSRGRRPSPASPCSTWTTCGPSPTPAPPGARREAAGARAIVDDEVERYARRASAPARWRPLVRSLRDRAEAVRQAELDRVAGRLAGLDDQQRDAVEAVTRAIVAKLLHEPTVRLKDAAGTRQGRAPRRHPPRPLRPLGRVVPLRIATRGSRWPVWQADARRRAARGRRASWWSSRPPATGASTSRSGSSAARACS